MIRLISLILLILFNCSNLPAQDKAKIGLQSGLNIAWQSVEQKSQDLQPIVSFNFTGFLDIQLASHVYMQPGLSLQGKGVSSKLDYRIADDSPYKVNMMYLEIPVNILHKFSAKGLGVVVYGGGPYAAIGISGRTNRSGGPFNENATSSTAAFDTYQSTDYGFNLSLGVELSSKIILRIQQGIGIFNIAPESSSFRSENGQLTPIPRNDIKNRVSSFSIGYLL